MAGAHSTGRTCLASSLAKEKQGSDAETARGDVEQFALVLRCEVANADERRRADSRQRQSHRKGATRRHTEGRQQPADCKHGLGCVAAVARTRTGKRLSLACIDMTQSCTL